MRKKLWFAAGLALPVIFLLGLIIQLQLAAWDLPIVRVAVRGYDPRDLISGHFLNLQPDWKKTDCSQFENAVCPQDRFRSSYVYYIPETKAAGLEKIIREPDVEAQLVFAFPKKGKPQILDFELNQKSWILYSQTKNAD